MVVLPEPVGPVTSRMPSGKPIRRSNVCWSSVKKPSSGKPQPQAFLVQNTHDDALAVVGRQARHAQIDQLAADLRSGCGRPAGCAVPRWTCWTGSSAGAMIDACSRFGGLFISCSTPSMR